MDSGFTKLRDQMKPVISQEEPPIYDLSATWVKLRRGNIHFSPAHDLVFNPCVRGGSRLCLYKQLDLPLPSTRFYVCLMDLESYPHNLFQIPTL
jgi:hypothetical protein